VPKKTNVTRFQLRAVEINTATGIIYIEDDGKEKPIVHAKKTPFMTSSRP
jgi:hypothetical protein